MTYRSTIVKLNNLIFMHRDKSHNLPKNLQSLFSCYNKNKFRRNKIRTDRKSSCLSTNGPKLWNDLNIRDSQSKTKNDFKLKIKILIVKS